MAGLLTRYLRAYWLKPFDAVNDAANATALLGFRWEAPILEIGSGDGAFSFLMHGGEFCPDDDRYDHVDPSKAGDIFDVHDSTRLAGIKRPATLRYQVGIDLKWTHLEKCRATGLYRHLVQAAPAPLPFLSHSFQTVFLYFPHGLIERGSVLDYAATLSEIRRVLRPDGALLMVAMNENVRGAFVCHTCAVHLERAGWTKAAAYFRRLDAGRFEEIGGAARTLEGWRRLLAQSGFNLVEGSSQISSAAWRMYDVQTRPLLRLLIRTARCMRSAGVKGVLKAVWVLGWWPVVAAVYAVGARPRPVQAPPTGRTVFALRATCSSQRPECRNEPLIL